MEDLEPKIDLPRGSVGTTDVHEHLQTNGRTRRPVTDTAVSRLRLDAKVKNWEGVTKHIRSGEVVSVQGHGDADLERERAGA
jgi:hypothetical protein